MRHPRGDLDSLMPPGRKAAAMATSETQERINHYYDECQVDYSLIWGTDDHLSMHYGYHDDEHSSVKDAVVHVNEVLADRVGIEEGDRVLDAGCGVGGSAIWLARERGAEVVGVNINEQQVGKARRAAAEAGVDDRVEFRVADFADTGLEDDSVDVYWSIEAVCHAEDKRAVIDEARRVVRPGGRLVITDGFRGDDYPPEGQEALDTMYETMALPGLATVDEFQGMLEDAGFQDVAFEDRYEAVRPSGKRMYRLARLTGPLAKLLEVLGVRSEQQTDHVAGAKAQWHALECGAWIHGLFTAEG